ncbi:TPA: hypothetical protein N0F65_011297 [Lagenidium giganteum]|uniref:Uncharacterized protein n=1 Tax=Lagenidium giganteum TaxID=4803 RepID=A0AAV2YUE8_9STRA|nr:TPA: hypothetical protein N0F65_011297 [Lagenidium giganteum]
MTCCCPWVSLAQIISRMGLAPYATAIKFLLGIFSLLMLPVIVVYIYAVSQVRGKVRARFDIPGSPLEDLLLSWCCGCCTVAQMATHVKSYKPGSCSFGPVSTLAPFEEA